MKSIERIFLILTTFIVVACICLWAMELSVHGTSLTACLGLGCSVAAAILPAAGYQLQKRRQKLLERSHQEELHALQQAHAQALANMRNENQAEMNAFRSSLSHSLRMPVAIIQGYAELLISGVIQDPDVAVEYLEKINQRSKYMTEAISRQFSSADSVSKSKLAYADLDLVSLVRQAASDMRAAAEEQGVRLQVISPEDALSMQADPYLLNRVLYNLIENALKYMGRPGVVTIRVLSQADHACLLVQDDGLGLSAEETAHIFEPNYQGSNHTVGQGYGLHLVRRAIEAHGGTVSAQSAPGRGMRISMTLPLAPKTT